MRSFGNMTPLHCPEESGSLKRKDPSFQESTERYPWFDRQRERGDESNTEKESLIIISLHCDDGGRLAEDRVEGRETYVRAPGRDYASHREGNQEEMKSV
jgi:hypothetical protein